MFDLKTTNLNRTNVFLKLYFNSTKMILATKTFKSKDNFIKPTKNLFI